MASIRERLTATGQLRFNVQYRHAGRQQTETFHTLKGAETFRDHCNLLGVGAALHALDNPEPDSPTVGTVVDAHIEALSGVTEGTRSDYKAYRRDMALLAQTPVNLLTRQAVSKWVNDLAERLAGKSIRNRHSLLSAAMTGAVRDGLVSENPCRGIRLPRTIRRDMTVLSHSDFAEFISYFDPFWQPLVVTLAGTGMRWSECIAVAVRDVDLDATPPKIQVRQAYKHTDGHGRELGPPKTRRGQRAISLPPQVVDHLIPLLNQRSGPDDLLFLNTHGRPITQSTFLVHVWQPAVRKLGHDVRAEVDGKMQWVKGPGKHPRVHDMRHTQASWQIAANVPLTELQHRLGHESIVTTSDTYGHLVPEAQARGARAAEVALSLAFPRLDDAPSEHPAVGAVAGPSRGLPPGRQAGRASR